MMHPATVVRNVSPEIGIGVLATQFIPKGTIVVVRDDFDIVLSQSRYDELPTIMRQAMETYMYRDRSGNLVMNWDQARYMNHSCCSNTLMSAYDMEIAVCDIEPGQELTCDYGLLNVLEPYELHCRCDSCRGRLRLDDIDRLADTWDAQLEESFSLAASVAQPLGDVMSHKQRQALAELAIAKGKYVSVRTLKYTPGK